MNFWIHVLIYNLGAIITLLMILKINPRYQLQNYPKDITIDMPPKTPEEKKKGTLWGLPFIIDLFLYPLIVGFIWRVGGYTDFLHSWLWIFLLMFSFNLVDLFILDWLMFCTITPKFILLPGTKGHPAYKNYTYHVIAAIKGTGFAIAGSLLFAGIIELTLLITRV